MALTPAEIQKRYRERHPEKVKAARVSGKEKDKVWRVNNRESINENGRKWYRANKAKIAALRKETRTNNVERAREYSRKDYEKHKEQRMAKHKEWSVANRERRKELSRKWIEKNKDRHLAYFAESAAARRLTTGRATPAWANKFFIKEIYHLARLRTKYLSMKHHVDHIVPLVSKFVCGLHVENNMQIILQKNNISKGNRIWPNMQESR